MNVNALIDSIVRQTMVLIAQLATTAGIRAPLAHTANQVFLDLVRELKDQGLGNKVIADMFGIALRTYHSRIQRLSESTTDGGNSLWESVLGYVQERQTVLRVDVLERFGHDDRAMVCGVLKDLVDTGIVFRGGRGDRTTYRAASPEEYSLADDAAQNDGLIHLVWVAINRQMPVTRAELEQTVPLGAVQIETCLEKLLSDDRITVDPSGVEPKYSCETCFIPVGSSAGWEAAVFDHYQALVTAICSKLELGTLRSTQGEAVGGSTYGFDVWPEHPHYEEVVGLLSRARQHAVSLRRKVEDYNRSHPCEARRASRVIYYTGQTFLDQEEPKETP